MNNQKNDNAIIVDVTYSVFHGFRKILEEVHVALALVDMYEKVFPDLLMTGLKMIKV